MPILCGRRLRPCEIFSAIGAGGIGVLNCARDRGLVRDPASKVFPAIFVIDPERLSRFRPKARKPGSTESCELCDNLQFGALRQRDLPRVAMELVSGETVCGPENEPDVIGQQ